MRDEAGRAVVARGLASIAVDTAERGGTEDEARLAMVRVLRAHGTTDASLVREAAAAVSDQPQPVDEPAEDEGETDSAARAQQIREALGVPSPADQLAAMLRGREWLLRFADALEE